MKVTLLKDWAGMSKGDSYDTKDKDVLRKGGELGVWKAVKATKEESENETPEVLEVPEAEIEVTK